MIIYIGIDDTDNLESRGTGFRARSLGRELEESGLGEVKGVTRHQLFVSPEIPYTSHNSSLCIEFEADLGDLSKIIQYCGNYMSQNCAEGSDPGLCISPCDNAAPDVICFGRDAKAVVLTKDEAYELAGRLGMHLSEHGGTGGGVIGALAGVGLRAWGQDGRFVWLKGIREMSGIYTAEEILRLSAVRSIASENGDSPGPEDLVDIGDWFRPVLINCTPTLIVERSDSSKAGWKAVDREKIKEKY